MKVWIVFVTSVVLLPLLCVGQADSQQSQGLSSGLMFLSIIGGFFLGQMALTAFILMLMAIVPPEEARSLSRVSRSVFNDDARIVQSLNNFTMEVGGDRNSRFLTGLLRSDPLNCMPQVMCELSSAQEPSTRTDTINDYKFLIKEMLQSDDDKDDATNEKNTGFRTGSMKKVNPTLKSKHKKKPVKKDDDDSSPEDDDSVSKQSDEEIVKMDPNEKAELMELEEQDAIEEKAWTDLIDEDPADIGFALKEMKKKEKVKDYVNKAKFDEQDSDESTENGYLNDLSYRRNLEILEKNLEGNFQQAVFRTSRAFQDSFVHRKQRELSQTRDIYDRVRIAAEVSNVTRSARKCRALFTECPLGGSGINKVVNNIRKAIVGTPVKGQNKKKSVNKVESSMVSVNDLQALVNQIQQPQGGTDVKVTVTIDGNNPMRMGQGPMMNYPYYTVPGYPNVVRPISRTIPSGVIPTTALNNTGYVNIGNNSNQNGSSSLFTEFLEPTEMTSSQDISGSSSFEEETTILENLLGIMTESPMSLVKTNIGQEEKILNPTAKPILDVESVPVLRDDPHINMEAHPTRSKTSSSKAKIPEKIEYQDRLKEASVLMKDLPKSSGIKTSQIPPTLNPVYTRVHQQLEDLIKLIDPKDKIKPKSEDSDSEESEESSEELKQPLVPRSKPTAYISSMPAPKFSKQTLVSRSKPAAYTTSKPASKFSNQPRYPYQTSKPSWIESAYDLFFSDKKTSPLPSKADEYIPSAQRHAFSSSIRAPMRNTGGKTKPGGNYNLPYGNKYYNPRFEYNIGTEKNAFSRTPRPREFESNKSRRVISEKIRDEKNRNRNVFRNQAVNSKPAANKIKNNKRRNAS